MDPCRSSRRPLDSPIYNIYVKVSACVCHGEVNFIYVSGRRSKGGGGGAGGGC